MNRRSAGGQSQPQKQSPQRSSTQSTTPTPTGLTSGALPLERMFSDLALQSPRAAEYLRSFHFLDIVASREGEALLKFVRISAIWNGARVTVEARTFLEAARALWKATSNDVQQDEAASAGHAARQNRQATR